MSIEPARSARWLAALHSTAPADRQSAEEAVRALYASASLAAPRICWFESPRAASWAIALLVERYSPAWPPLVAAARRSPESREQLEAAAGALRAAAGVETVDQVLTLAGGPLSPLLGFFGGAAALHQARLSARMKIHGGAAALFATPPTTDVLARAQSSLWGGNDRGVLTSGLFAPTTGTLIGYSHSNDYSWSAMASDEQVAGDDAPSILRAAWRVAFDAGPWWPFQGLAVLTDRPVELHVNADGVPHRADGPAVVFRDGWSVFAWNGKAIEADWILRPETISAASLRRADPDFRRMVQARGAQTRPSKPQPPSRIFGKALSPNPDERLSELRAYAGTPLTLLDRYVAGDHVEVWRELTALGAGVRADPLAADALAVAAETMRRVALNVDTLITRLTAMGYVFTCTSFHVAAPHARPDRGVQKTLARLEKGHGLLPLSLRTFYEVVGAVCLVGRHPRVAPDAGPVAPDPLWVYGAADAFDSVEGDEDGGEIVIAPDDLHKAGQSGGDPYTIAIPNPAADAPVVSTPYRISFVEYLRLCFRCGGFPGYSGVDRDVPAVIEELASGLLPI